MEKKLENNIILKNIMVFLGPPGSGKGTLSKLLVDRLGWIKLSTGDLFRKHIYNNTDFGKEIDFIVKSGKLISDEFVIKIMQDWFLNNFFNNKIILDGYPRTHVQAKALCDFLRFLAKDYKINLHVVKLSIDNNTIISRLSKRYICSNNKCQNVYSIDNIKIGSCNICGSSLFKRSDDEIEAILNRLEIYYKHENHIVNCFRINNYKIIDLFVARPIEDIYQDFFNKNIVIS